MLEMILRYLRRVNVGSNVVRGGVLFCTEMSRIRMHGEVRLGWLDLANPLRNGHDGVLGGRVYILGCRIIAWRRML